MSVPTPLREIKILDLSVLLPGPYCTMLLAALGAQVLKVENPANGDLMRSMAPGTFRWLNADKKLLALDLKQAAGREILLRLAAECDVLVEGFRPGVTAKLGVDFPSVARVNPAIIYCSLSGFGQSGPYHDWPGHDLNFMGMAGLLSISGDPASGRPEYPYGAQYSDLMGSMFAANAILAALVGRGREPQAQYLDVSLLESTGLLMMPRYMDFLEKGRPGKEEFMARGPYGVFVTKDGKYLSLGIVEDHFWVRFCQVAGWDDWAHDPAFAGWNQRNRLAELIKPRLEQTIKQKDLGEWMDLLRAADVAVAPVHDFDEWTRDPHFRARGFFPPAPDPADPLAGLPRFPIPGWGRRDQPGAGELPVGRDTEACLAQRGFGAEELKTLREQKII